MAQELLTLQNLAKYYTSAQSVVVGLNPTNLTFCRGEFVAITGESGSGKSTLAHVLGGILPYEGGELLFKGKPTSHYDSGDWERYRRDCVSFISQNYGILPGSSVIDNVTCALRLVGVDKAAAQEKAEEILKRVELWDLRRRRAAKLSSGQKQRLSIARALAKPAPVLIADEPTGNLDAENSAMVIALLSEAAKDRLVILITHEFSEAADSVTRHIELHDGRVTMDVKLRDVPELAAPASKTAKGEGKKGLSWFVARFQIKARPVWAVLMLCLFAAAVFAMFAITGTFIANLDDTFTYNYSNLAFRNGDSRRIVVVRTDGKEFTQEDNEQLLSVKYVEALEEYGYATDIQYAYREGVDYEIKNRLEDQGGGGFGANYVAVQSYSVSKTQGNMPFVRTVPTLAEGKEFLTAGRLPENLYEVVAAGGEELLGQRITVLVQDQKNWSKDTFIRMEVTVVGVTDYGAHLYFHKDLGRMMLANANVNIFYMPIPEGGSMIGPVSVRGTSNGKQSFLYKIIMEGRIAGEAELISETGEQLEKIVWEKIEQMNSFFENFSLDAEKMWVYYDLQTLDAYAGRLGVEGRGEQGLLRPMLEEMGLDSNLFELDYAAQQAKIMKTLTEENMERLRAVAEPLLSKTKAAYEKEKEAFLAMDRTQLTIDELMAVAEKWGSSLDIYPIQPGEAVVTIAMADGIVRENMTEKEGNMDDAEEFLTYDLPNMGAIRDLDFFGLTGEERIAAEDKCFKNLTVIGTVEQGHNRVVLLHPDDFEELTYPGKGGQISVYVEDYAYVDRVLDAIHALGYGAISPYQEGAVSQNEELAEQRMQTLRVCLLALVAVIALQILLLRAMFSMETESYRLLSHIGLNGATAQRSVFWQIMLFAVGGQLLGVGLIGACTAGGVEQLVHILRYLPLSYRVVLCLIHLGSSAFTAVWSMKALKKQVFPQSGAEPDLDWDVLDEEVEA